MIARLVEEHSSAGRGGYRVAREDILVRDNRRYRA